MGDARRDLMGTESDWAQVERENSALRKHDQRQPVERTSCGFHGLHKGAMGHRKTDDPTSIGTRSDCLYRPGTDRRMVEECVDEP